MNAPTLALDKVSKHFGAMVVAILVMLTTSKGIWGLIVERFGWQIFPLERTVIRDAAVPVKT